jgi:hypothetical protein
VKNGDTSDEEKWWVSLSPEDRNWEVREMNEFTDLEVQVIEMLLDGDVDVVLRGSLDFCARSLDGPAARGASRAIAAGSFFRLFTCRLNGV